MMPWSVAQCAMVVTEPAAEPVALGILAGGRGSRLGGIDKAWMRRDGRSQVERLLDRFAAQFDQVLVSANRNQPRYRDLPVTVVADAVVDIGPMGGIHALAHAATTNWLLTMPVDLVDANDCLLPSLRAHGGPGASIQDEQGPQPLLALWRLSALRPAIAEHIARADYSVQHLQQRLGMAKLHLAGVRLGNLNTPADLIDAGIVLE